MVEQVLAAHARAAMRIRIIAPAKYTRVGEVVWKEIAEPVDAVNRRPGLLAVSVQSMDSDDAPVGLTVERAIEQRGSILNDRFDALSYHLQALYNCSSYFC
jgi:hypothetical protein